MRKKIKKNYIKVRKYSFRSIYSYFKYKNLLTNIENKEKVLNLLLKYDAILQREATNSEAISNIVNIFIKLNKIKIAKKILKKYSNSLEKKLNIALNAKIYTSLGEYQKAITLWKLLFNKELEVESYRATFHLANIYLNLKDYQSFLIYVNYSKIFYPKTFYYEQLMSRYYYSIGEWDLSIRYSEILIQKRVFLISSLERLIKSYLNKNEPEKALQILKSIKEFTTVPRIKFYLMGRCFYSQYNYSNAIKYFRKALGVDSMFKEGIIWLAKAYYANKEFEKSKKLYNMHKGINDIKFLGTLAEASGQLLVAESVYINNSSKLVDFYINYRYWGKAYRVIREQMKKNNVNILMREKRDMIEKISDEVKYNISDKYEKNENIDNFLSTEYIIEELVHRINKMYRNNRPSSQLKKIALVLGSLGPGGAERQCSILYNELQRTINTENLKEVRLYVTNLSRTPRDSFYIKDINNTKFVIEYFNRNEIIDPFSLIELKEYASLIQYIQPISRQQSIIHLILHLSKFRPDIVHGWLDETIINSFIAASILNISGSVGRWGSMPPGYGRMHTEVQSHNVKYLHSAYKSISKLKNIQFTANSSITGYAYADWIGIDRSSINIIHNGLNFNSLVVTKDSNTLKYEYNIPNDAKIIGSVNRISEEKQPFLWVDIAKEVIESYDKSIYFILVGDGPLFEHVQKYIYSLNMSEKIILCGNQDDVANWYNIMDIFILTSKVEGLSNSMLEAQYLGVPVIVPDVGGLKEGLIPNDTGVLLHSKPNAEEFSMAITQLLKKSWKEKEKKHNRQFIIEQFSPNQMLRNTLKTYNKVLRTH